MTHPLSSTFVSLANIEVGQKAMLCKNTMPQLLEKKLLAIGFSKLIPLRVTQKRKGGLVVSVGNARIALDQALAQQVFLQKL